MTNRKQPTRCTISEILIQGLWAITICTLSNSLRSTAFQITRQRSLIRLYYPPPRTAEITTPSLHRHDKVIDESLENAVSLLTKSGSPVLQVTASLGHVSTRHSSVECVPNTHHV
ncbi:hypothetical protein TNCV_2995561 [Trichonephila clavipes]|nr:hypothetical protein TNCV_2995561 [Trichonephila clavipes]